MGESLAKFVGVVVILGIAWAASPGLFIPEGVTLRYTASSAPSEGQLNLDIDKACRRSWGVLHPLMKAPDTVKINAAQPDGSVRSAVLRCKDRSVVSTNVSTP